MDEKNYGQNNFHRKILLSNYPKWTLGPVWPLTIPFSLQVLWFSKFPKIWLICLNFFSKSFFQTMPSIPYGPVGKVVSVATAWTSRLVWDMENLQCHGISTFLNLTWKIYKIKIWSWETRSVSERRTVMLPNQGKMFSINQFWGQSHDFRSWILQVCEKLWNFNVKCFYEPLDL